MLDERSPANYDSDMATTKSTTRTKRVILRSAKVGTVTRGDARAAVLAVKQGPGGAATKRVVAKTPSVQVSQTFTKKK